MRVRMPLHVLSWQLGNAHVRYTWPFNCLPTYLPTNPLGVYMQVLLLDADNLALTDPSGLFYHPAYTASGLLTWPDFWPSQAKPHVWELLGVEQRDVPRGSHESGQLLLHKAWVTLLLLLSSVLCMHATPPSVITTDTTITAAAAAATIIAADRSCCRSAAGGLCC